MHPLLGNKYQIIPQLPTSRLAKAGSISPNPNLYLDENGEKFFQKPIEYSISKSVFPIIAKYLCAHYGHKGLVINNVEPHAIIDEPKEDFLKNFEKISPMKMIHTNSLSG